MFKITKLNIIKHPFFKKLEFNFVNKGEENNGPYISLLIGPNGTGKSQVFSAVIEIFNILFASHDKKRLVQKFAFDFSIDFIVDSQLVSVVNIENDLTVILNNQPVELWDIPLPSKLLASAINLTDRYPNLTRRKKAFNESYEYLGIRSASNNAFISTHVRSIIKNLNTSLVKNIQIDRYLELFKILQLKPIIKVRYKAGPRFQIDKNNDLPAIFNSVNILKEFYEDYIRRVKEKGRKDYRLEKYGKLLKEDKLLALASNFVLHNRSAFSKRSKGLVSYESVIDFSNPQSIFKYKNEIEPLRVLSELELISLNEIKLDKQKASFKFEQASSGEYHMLTSFIGILSRMEDNSIILIDEPEISLHPNWQMLYVDTLNRVFEFYKSCHFLIATHSHFLVSDLKAEQSAITTLYFDGEEERIKVRNLDWKTYAWSAEQVLIDVFKVPSTRNFYVAEYIGEVLKLIAAENPDHKLIKEKIKGLDAMNLKYLKSNDPLKTVVDKLLKRG